MSASDERAFARTARASWGYALGGARRHAESAREWVRAEGLEAHIKERDARALSARIQRDARMRARKGRRAHAPSAPPRALTDIELKGRAFTTRAARSLGALAVPVGLMLYPPYALIHGDPLAMLAWPVAYGYLAWDGWMYGTSRREPEERASESGESKSSNFLKRKRATGAKPTPEEAAIIERIRSWDELAPERRLHEVFPGEPVIDESGLLIPIEFAGQWTPAKLDAQADQFRALLAVPDEVRTQFKPGGTADRANLRIRTRIRELDLTWTPEREGIGLDADTGEVIDVDDTDRILTAGMSGAGKSVVLRVLMAKALRRPNTALVIIDLKVEGALWAHVARVESEPDGIQDVVDDLVAEMKEREAIMRARGMDMWEATEDRPFITVVVDEGAELMAEVPDSTAGNRSLARRARSAGIRLWWATQKPTVTGKGAGLDSAISMQLTTQICLAVPSPTEARNVLGEDATMKGWHADDLQKGGWALIREQGADRAPDPMRVWFMTKEDVKALPAREAWRRTSVRSTVDTTDALTIALELSEGLHGVPTVRLASALGVSDIEVHRQMHVHGLAPEPHAFAMGDGVKARGYRRSTLEAARDRREGQG